VAGGEAMVEALYHGAPRVMGVEANPQFIDLLRTYSEYNGHLLKKKGVEVTVGEGRAIAEKHSGEFDLVMLRGLDASGLSASSTPGVSENYSVTVEAFESYFHALAPNGMLAITMRMSPPPWKAIRLLPTAAEALKRAGYDQRETRVVFIRNVMYALCLVKPDGFTETDTAKIRKWALSRSFDISIMTGLKPAETNQFTELIEDTYYRIGMAVLTSDGKKALDEYMFDIRATTDDRPYFGAVVRSNSLKGIQEYRLKSQQAAASIGGSPDSVPDGDSGPGDIPDGDTGPGDIPDGDEADTSTPAPKSEETDEDDELAPTDSIFDEIRQMPVELWGVYLQWATLIQALLFSLLVIVVPLFGRRHGIQKVPGKVRTVVFFACLGIGFMFAEIVAIRKLTLFLANPIFATTLVLAAILVFTGIGSLVSARLKTRPVRAIRIAAIGIVVSILVWTIALDPLMRSLLGLSTFLRVLLSIVFIAPLAFFLGFPFPTAMSVLDSDSARQPLVPWAWAINGAMGVVATVAAAVLSTALGFRVVMLIAAGLYILAWLTFPGGLKDNPARESEPLW
jgi:spermidine synthase